MRNSFVAASCGFLVIAVATITGGWSFFADQPQAGGVDHRLVGTVAPGSLLRAGMTIANHSSSRLVISNRRPQCDCSGDLPQTWMVPPHQSQWVTGVVAAPAEAGPFLRRIEFQTSDPAQPIRCMEVSGVVDAKLSGSE